MKPFCSSQVHTAQQLTGSLRIKIGEGLNSVSLLCSLVMGDKEASINACLYT